MIIMIRTLKLRLNSSHEFQTLVSTVHSRNGMKSVHARSADLCLTLLSEEASVETEASPALHGYRAEAEYDLSQSRRGEGLIGAADVSLHPRLRSSSRLLHLRPGLSWRLKRVERQLFPLSEEVFQRLIARIGALRVVA